MKSSWFSILLLWVINQIYKQIWLISTLKSEVGAAAQSLRFHLQRKRDSSRRRRRRGWRRKRTQSRQHSRGLKSSYCCFGWNSQVVENWHLFQHFYISPPRRLCWICIGVISEQSSGGFSCSMLGTTKTNLKGPRNRTIHLHLRSWLTIEALGLAVCLLKQHFSTSHVLLVCN